MERIESRVNQDMMIDQIDFIAPVLHGMILKRVLDHELDALHNFIDNQMNCSIINLSLTEGFDLSIAWKESISSKTDNVVLPNV